MKFILEKMRFQFRISCQFAFFRSADNLRKMNIDELIKTVSLGKGESVKNTFNSSLQLVLKNSSHLIILFPEKI